VGQTTDQIENEIDSTRADLKSNLQELEGRVRSATDWRHQFRQHTGVAMAIAFGGGILLSAIFRRGSGPTANRSRNSTH
jgi:hypothetical protein